MFVRIGITALICSSAFMLTGKTSRACGNDGLQQRGGDPSLTANVRRLSALTAARQIDKAELSKVIHDLRLHRYEAVNRLIAARNGIAGKGQDANETSRKLAIWDRATDRVAGQKSAAESRLFWHTSLQSACREAAHTGRPIISLRLLGRLDEDLSCANSRFFRRVLYPDSEVGDLLRNHFVLHWESVREVPIVTIEFESKRRLRQPLVGNSVHLVLDPQGRPFDALPGLVSPKVFRSWLSQVDSFWRRSETADQRRFWASAVDYHRDRAKLRRRTSPLAIRPDQRIKDLNPLDPSWQKLSLTYYQSLNPQGRERLKRHQFVAAERAMVTAPTKAAVESPLMRMVRTFEQNMSRDTVFNLFALQTKIDDWFSAMPQPPDHQQLTQRIYANAFLMPLDDPWLGLSPQTAFTALDSGGRIEPAVYNKIQ